MQEIKDILRKILLPEVPVVKSNRIPSAVIIPFSMVEGEPFVLFLKKVDSSYPHGGQVCFPGGCKEEKDKSLLDTALREFEEETGIPASRVEVIGGMEPVKTRSTNFIIYPFVGFIEGSKPEVSFDRREIQEAFWVPFDYLLISHPFPVVEFPYRGRVFTTPVIQYGNHVIWGATARILDLLLGKFKSAI